MSGPDAGQTPCSLSWRRMRRSAMRSRRFDESFWCVVAWRLLWCAPIYAARAVFVGLIFIGWGLGSAKRAWRDTT